MKKNKIGIETDGYLPFDGLDTYFKNIKNCGYDFSEFSLTAFPLIIEGKLNQRLMDHLLPQFEEAELEYTIHIGTGLDLRTEKNPELHLQVLKTSIDICKILKSDILTVHYEQKSQRKNIEKQFYDLNKEAAYYAGEQGVTLCMENIETEDYRLVPELIDYINSPAMRMTLDFGHLYLASRYFGDDYYKAIDEVAPYVAHTHIHDNTGTYEPLRLSDYDKYKTLGLNERIAFGQGDIHIPVFWGSLPIVESIKRLRSHGYSGRFLLECGGYSAFNRQMYEELTKKLNED